MLQNTIKNKKILITGGAGSIGSQLVKELILYQPLLIIIYDQAETDLYYLKKDIGQLFFESKIEFVLGSVNNHNTLERVFKSHIPDIVIHSAAYKHVSIAENNPIEVSRVNIFGTKIVSDIARKYKAENFYLISTDKSVYPKNVMGYTKRVAELYIRVLNIDSNKTKFNIIRFGNIIETKGSVIPLIIRQSNNNLPITITSKEATRFFMTIYQACSFIINVLMYSTESGKIFHFQMGEQKNVFEFVKQYLKDKYSILIEEKQIKIIGLQQGEKLTESLFYQSSICNAWQHNNNITICAEKQIDIKRFKQLFSLIEESIITNDKDQLLKSFKEIVK